MTLKAPFSIHITQEVPMKLNDLKGFTKDELEKTLSTLSDTTVKYLKEEMEYYLLCYPQGTGDDELEDLMDTLTEVWYPEDL